MHLTIIIWVILVFNSFLNYNPHLMPIDYIENYFSLKGFEGRITPAVIFSHFGSLGVVLLIFLAYFPGRTIIDIVYYFGFI